MKKGNLHRLLFVITKRAHCSDLLELGAAADKGVYFVAKAIPQCLLDGGGDTVPVRFRRMEQHVATGNERMNGFKSCGFEKFAQAFHLDPAFAEVDSPEKGDMGVVVHDKW